MIISITAILALVSLVLAIPVDGDIFARSSTNGKLDTRMGAISTTLDLRSENPSEHALMNLESRVDAGTQTLGNPRFSSQRYAGFQVLAYFSKTGVQDLCSSVNAGAACDKIGNTVFAVLEVLMVLNAYKNGDIDHGILHLAGVWGLTDGVSKIDTTGLTDAAIEYVKNILATSGNPVRRSLPDNEHDEVDFTSDTGIDGRPGLIKRDSPQFGLKITMSSPGKLPKDKSLIADLAHGFAKQWGETAFSQTGWDDYSAGLKDSDGNTILKFRITPSEGTPSSGNADLP